MLVSSNSSLRTDSTVLSPLLHKDIDRILTQECCPLYSLVNKFGSPLNIIIPHIFKKNISHLQKIFSTRDCSVEIFYAAKANKSYSLVSQAVCEGIGVDVSSVYEFRDAVAAGIKPDQICATGPGKTDVFLKELILFGALISIDSCEELRVISSLITQYNITKPIRVMLRFRPSVNQSSRFGMSGKEISDCISIFSHRKNDFAFKGFHFHLSGYSADDRSVAFMELIEWVNFAQSLGLVTQIIDIGGGVPIQYIHAQTYHEFSRTQHSGNYRNGKVPEDFYPYGGSLSVSQWFNRFLDTPCSGYGTIIDYLKQENITLAIEPGRCLLDQVGVTLFRVLNVKTLNDGNSVLFVEGSSFNACETWFSSEYLIDPIHLPVTTSPEKISQPCRFYIAGHSCLESDVITNRFIEFKQVPKRGDILLYANTAGYQMDLLENEFHRVPMPHRIVVNCDFDYLVSDYKPGEKP